MSTTAVDKIRAKNQLLEAELKTLKKKFEESEKENATLKKELKGFELTYSKLLAEWEAFRLRNVAVKASVDKCKKHFKALFASAKKMHKYKAKGMQEKAELYKERVELLEGIVKEEDLQANREIMSIKEEMVEFKNRPKTEELSMELEEMEL